MLSSQHLLGLVNDILDLSRIEAGETRVARRDAWTGGAVYAALELVRPQAAVRGVRLIDAGPAEGVPYVGDEDRVRQILVNLLSNAVKFTAEGGKVTVACGWLVEPPAGDPFPDLRGSGPWVCVTVADTGIGIPAEEQDRIFEPFHQVDRGHTRTTGGTGLGLAISRQLARLMGGDLTVESTPGAGSTFTLRLPAVRREDSGQETAWERGARSEHEAAALRTPGLGELGELLRDAINEILTAYSHRLRSDAAMPNAHAMRPPELEDHQLSLLGDLAQSLVIVGEGGAEGAEGADLLRDGSAIQRTIADRHGARRHAQGWDEAEVRRDHQILREEVERAVLARTGRASAEGDAALTVLLRLIDRAEAISVAAWRRAAAAPNAGG